MTDQPTPRLPITLPTKLTNAIRVRGSVGVDGLGRVWLRWADDPPGAWRLIVGQTRGEKEE